MLVSAYVNGSTAGSPPPKRATYGGVRGKVRGWTSDAVRRHTKWLYSVDSALLVGLGLSVTLTMREMPGSAAELHRLRRAFIERLRRSGITRLHWVIEWQRRGVPHFHMAVYWPSVVRPEWAAQEVFTAWLQVCSPTVGASIMSQDVKVISGALGWLQYLSKHAARGVRHYQRNGHPEGWESTGRLWGHIGAWPTSVPMRFDVPRGAYHRYRRLVRSWRLADARGALLALQARSDADPKALRAARRRVVAARGALRCADPRLSAVRGVSDWVPEHVAIALVSLLADEGWDVVQRVE